MMLLRFTKSLEPLEPILSHVIGQVPGAQLEP